jgi:drug/metabolite transporter (DMT)-like permease
MTAFYFVSCSIIWGLTWIAIKFQFHAVDSRVAVFYRFILASSLLFIWVIIKKQPLRFKKQDHINFATQGLFMFCLNYNLTYWASHLAPSALVALAFTTLIYFNIFSGHFFMRLPLDKKVLAGAAVSLSGMFFISYNELQYQQLQPTSIWGFLISLAATLSASTGNLISMKSRIRKIPISSNNAWGMLYGSIFTLIYCLALGSSFEIHKADSAFIWSFLYLTIFGTILSFGAYLKLIETIGPSKAAFTSVISPIIAVFVSVFFKELSLNWVLTIGILLCLMGNVLALIPSHLLRLKPYAD